MTSPSFLQFIRRYKIRVQTTLVNANPRIIGEWPPGSTHFKCRLRNADDRSYTFYFSQGPAIFGEPELHQMLDCLRSDATYADYDFATYCSERALDYVRPSPAKAHDEYVSVRAQTRRFRRFLGEKAFAELNEIHF